MDDPQKILLSQRDAQAREDLIVANDAFIRRCASKAAGCFVDSHHDAYSAALSAFNDALTAYEPEKGAFHPLAAAAIRNRVTDLLRQESRQGKAAPFSALSDWDDEGREMAFDVPDATPVISDAALEIDAIRRELDAFGISFFDLPRYTPKFGKTKRACLCVIEWLWRHPEAVVAVKKKNVLPTARLQRELGVGSKVLERCRAYIIAGMLIWSGDYPILQGYIPLRKEGT